MTGRLVALLLLLYALASAGAGGDARVGVSVDGETYMPTDDPVEAAVLATSDKLATKIEAKLTGLLEDTFTDECRQMVTEAFDDHLSRILDEGYLQYETQKFQSQCPKEKTERRAPKKTADSIRLVYLLLVHTQGFQVKRLIESLDEPNHNFVVHVDGKVAADALHTELMEYAATKSNVHVMTQGRTSISWGGFNIVQATLNGIGHALDLGLEFDWLINLSGYTYPLISNSQIRETLAKHPTDTNLMEIRPTPNTPAERTWHHYVECDDRMRRIWRLRPPRGISMYVGSQWFIISKDFSRYLVTDRVLVPQYTEYGRKMMVADENFFATIMKNSPFCHTHHNRNNVHVQFDQWEHSKATRDPAKCLQPNPDHCGRSPTVNTLEYMPVLELSQEMFARKFDPEVDDSVLDAIDELRARNQKPQDGAFFRSVMIKQAAPSNGWRSSSHLCLELGSSNGEKAAMRPCDNKNPNQLFDVGPCSSDGTLELATEQPMNATAGQFSRPFCPIRAQNRRCLDVEGEKITPGTQMISFHCSMKWNQLFSFGGPDHPGSIFISIPYKSHRTKTLCL